MDSRKIKVLFLAFFDFEVIKTALESLIAAKNYIEIIVIENKSINTEEKIKPFMLQLLKRNEILKYYLFERNLSNNSYEIVIDRDLEYLTSNEYFIITDGDIFVDSIEWLHEELKILGDHRELFACGITMSEDNLPTHNFPNAKSWIPAPISIEPDYIESATGIHLTMFRSNCFLSYWQHFRKTNEQFVDGNIARFCYEFLRMKWARTVSNKGRHLTWDSYGDLNNPYTKLRLKKTHSETWFTTTYYSKIWLYENGKRPIYFYDWQRVIRKQIIPVLRRKANSLKKRLLISR